jgi:hypothetical protein
VSDYNDSHSKEFYELVKSIGESRSKQEEDGIILREVAVLKQKMVITHISYCPLPVTPLD